MRALGGLLSPVSGRRGRARAWLFGLLCAAVVGLWASRAGTVTFSQQTLPFSGLDSPEGAAVDAAGDVVLADFFNNGWRSCRRATLRSRR